MLWDGSDNCESGSVDDGGEVRSLLQVRACFKIRKAGGNINDSGGSSRIFTWVMQSVPFQIFTWLKNNVTKKTENSVVKNGFFVYQSTNLYLTQCA